MNKHKVLGHPNDYIHTIMCLELQPCKNKLPPSRVLHTVCTDNSFSARTTDGEKTRDQRALIILPNKYRMYRDECLEIPEPFVSIWEEHLKRISAVKSLVEVESTKYTSDSPGHLLRRTKCV